jgi:MFS family permease
LLVFAGATLTASNISINTSLQEDVEEKIRGRIVSLYQLALSGGIAMGALFTGFMVTKFNISIALLINGIFAVILQVWLLWKQLKAPVTQIIP